jgi:alpha,alpha-trehalase
MSQQRLRCVLVASLALAACASQSSELARAHHATAPQARATRALSSWPASPDELFGALFADVQLKEIFADQKTFADAVPKRDPATVVGEYERTKHDAGFNLKAFVQEQFTLPSNQGVTPPQGLSLVEHIGWLWPALTRSIPSVAPGDSLLPMPERYVVPGGRYQELYYWDSYFTMLGLVEAKREDLVTDMLENFAYAIREYGHIPNGSRTYQLSRSQPPFFSNMLELAAGFAGQQVYTAHLRELRREHAFWMDGERTTPRGQAVRRVVRLADGTLLNRYWDDRDTPRPESYAYDVATASQAPERAATEVYRDLRAAAESGWDFSSRWLADGMTLSTIRTTAIIPVDLNSLLYQLEVTIERTCAIVRDAQCVREFAARKAQRADAIERYLWDDAGHHYADYDWQRAQSCDAVTAAMVFPLFARIAPPERAQQTADALRRLIAPGGLLTTVRTSGQQWDAPNGWAPLTWIAVEGLRRYELQDLAREIATRFLARVEALYASEGKLVEKYDVSSVAVVGGGGGEYPLQDGFGWTNGVTLKLLSLYGSARR